MKEYKLELEGKVSFVEFEDGVEVARSEINQDTVLKVLVNALDQGLQLMEDKDNGQVQP
jgi:hypothetical protein